MNAVVKLRGLAWDDFHRSGDGRGAGLPRVVKIVHRGSHVSDGAGCRSSRRSSHLLSARLGVSRAMDVEARAGGSGSSGRPGERGRVGCAQVTRTGSAASRGGAGRSGVTGSTGQGAWACTHLRVLAATALDISRGLLPMTSRSAPRSPATATMTRAGSPATRIVLALAPCAQAMRRASRGTVLVSGSSSCWVIGSVGASRPTRYSRGGTTCRIVSRASKVLARSAATAVACRDASLSLAARSTCGVCGVMGGWCC